MYNVGRNVCFPAFEQPSNSESEEEMHLYTTT